ncbi:uncharacterized protein LOC143290966 [Babylonia areolata]|uniref:uncharacterized protein LOC143290966 n=1 Tax=Babylonia areolata TaxID=304850 RepID=UPI003FD03C40
MASSARSSCTASSSSSQVVTTPPSTQSSSAPESAWMPFVRDAFPNLHKQTYFVPPFHFNQMPFYPEVVAGETVQVLAYAPQQPPPKKRNAKLPLEVVPPQVAGTAFTGNSPGLQTSRVLPSDVQDDLAQGYTLECLRVLAERTQQVMLVLSQLHFKKYLDKKTDPILAATAALLPGTQHLSVPLVRGECDILVLHRHYGLVVGEIKSVGGGSFFPSASEGDQHKMVVDKVKRAVNQLNNQAFVLNHLVSDLGVKVTKTLILPNVTSAQLRQAMGSDASATQASWM